MNLTLRNNIIMYAFPQQVSALIEQVFWLTHKIDICVLFYLFTVVSQIFI